MKRFDQINVIPFIDIMLVLLAIVLTTASFIAQGIIEVELPEAEAAQPMQDEQLVEITIDAAQNYYFDSEALSLDDLEQRLQSLEKQTPIVLRVDKAARFEYFVAVIDLLKQAQLKHLSIMTRESA